MQRPGKVNNQKNKNIKKKVKEEVRGEREVGEEEEKRKKKIRA